MNYQIAGEFLPENVGIPLGEKAGVSYYMLEVHYDNQALHEGELILITSCLFKLPWFYTSKRTTPTRLVRELLPTLNM